ncbi:MAG TPA: hypothetical protein VGX28_01090 [Frankiaceae bacterium]|nr:hypothetical protein [Frankiaceae bacterium]
MFRRHGKALGVAAAAAIAAGTGAVAEAATEVPAFTLYAAVVQADATANLADTSAAFGDNITCDPAPVVDGHMLNPRAGVVVGEVYGQAEIVGHWKCVSLDTGAVYSATGTVTDWYYTGGHYVSGLSANNTLPATAGATTVNPNRIVRYAGGSPALNTWHYARFVGTTTTGRTIRGVSELFYVAGV